MVDNNMYENNRIEEFGLVYQDECFEDYSDKPEKQCNLEDAFWITRNNCGYVNLKYWADITGYSMDEIIVLAEGKLIWQDPVRYDFNEQDKYTGWLPKEQYLMGNRVQKYKDAIYYHQRYGRFAENIALLKENLPDEINGEDIHVNLGSTWVLSIEGFIADFIAELLEMNTPPKVEYDAYRGKWYIESKGFPNKILNDYTYGTIRMPALKIIEHKMNAKSVNVYDQVPRLDKEGTDLVLNKVETLAAQEKAKAIDIRFQDYCHGDKVNEDKLQEAFTSQYGYGVCRFDGSNFSFTDVSKKITMFNYQKDAIVHSFCSPSVLFADKVGAGKTIEYSCSVHEQLRMGLAQKAIIVVPNTTLSAAYGTYMDLFPDDKVLMIRPKSEFSPANRIKTLNLMKTNDYKVVFMAYSSFDMLTLTKKYAFEAKDKEIRMCRRQIANAASYKQRCRLKSVLKRLIRSAEKYKDTFKDTETACFDLMGFDLIVVDEAHNYKNITLDYGGSSIVGMHKKGSKRADNMLQKVEYLQKQGGRVILATGTPITNSLADLYVFQRFLQSDEMKLCNIFHFNDWINTFCEEESAFEVDVDSRKGRFATRFSRFHNLPELMAMFSQVCHFYQGESEELGLPNFTGYDDVLVKASEEQKEYINELGERTEAIRSHEVGRKEDNLLKIVIQGRLVALDIRLVKPDIKVVDSENKVKACARTVALMYNKFTENTQIIFSDISTPKSSFNVYDELRAELFKLGIPKKQIMFIHEADTEAKRIKAERLFNNGKIKILIGSTQKLGTGSNVQQRLIAVHHLDVPWRPADMIQREGRILRQGNTSPKVFIFRYITQASFDAYIYQLLESKQKFISQFLSGTLSAVHREETDCADTVLSYAEIKALAIGNPLIKKRVEVSNMLERARISQRQKKKELLNLGEFLERVPAQIAQRKQLISNTKADIAQYKTCREPVCIDERRSFGEELILALKENVMYDRERLFSDYQGFDVILPKHMQKDKAYVLLKRKGSNQYIVNMETDKILGCCQRLDNCLDNLPKELMRHIRKLDELSTQKKQAEADVYPGNPYDDKVKELSDRLKEIDEILKEEKIV